MKAEMVAHILYAWEETSRSEKEGGRHWYETAHQQCQAVAERTGQPVRVVCEVVAALSVGCPWEGNIKQAEELIKHGDAAVVVTYRQQKRTALGILNGTGGLHGPKVTAFALLLEDPTASFVTIDRHAVDVALGYRADKTERQRLVGTAVGYERVVEAYREAARVLGESPSTIQAATWMWWRKKVKRGGRHD